MPVDAITRFDNYGTNRIGKPISEEFTKSVPVYNQPPGKNVANFKNKIKRILSFL